VEAGNDRQWEAVQARLGTRLPEDWRQFGLAYGSGAFHDAGRLDIWILNPFSAEFEAKSTLLQANLEAMKAGEGDDYVPYPVFPAKGGLLALGDDVNGNELYWLTAGRPDKWRIVVRGHSNDSYEEFDGPLFSFLAGVFRKEVSVGAWPDPFFSDRRRLSFRPAPLAPVQTEFPKTLYVLYVENGNRAGFWVRNASEQEGVFYFVRTVGGKAEGPLAGIPEEFERQPVVIDLYWDAELVEANVDIGSCHRPTFYRAQSPVG
jgi:hypothetical protein